ncbi:MAG: hypothetical protein MUC88_08835 [Planctomycetes bacterium]|jgi:hypothetical protein|nr:hypothetical protein [Planctomycetota bacterium]
MSQTERYQRVRLLVKRLNRQRKQQARQIDILCNDLIGAQRSFLHRLQDIGFAAEFYRALLGGTDVNRVLAQAGRVFRQELPGAGVAFFLRQAEGCELYAWRSDEALYREPDRPEGSFDPELVDRLCKTNRICFLDDLLGLGFDGQGDVLNRFSLVTLPLTDLGRSLGFLLLYRRRPEILTAEELGRIQPVLCGLAQAVRSARVPLPSGE